MKILIIGSSGFIGSHLSAKIKRIGETVTEAASTSARVAHLVDIFSDLQPDVCVNCSGAAHVPNSFSDPYNDFSRNVVAVYEILEAIRRQSRHTRFVHLSSAAVYGNPKILPVAENAPLSPVSPYGYHKMAAEQFCTEFAKIYGIRTVSLRIFSAFGPRLRKQLFWDTYCKWRNSPTVKLFGTGGETRDFIFIDDLCNAIVAVIYNAEFCGEQINVASGRAVTIREAVTLLLNSLGGSKPLIFEGNKREGDPDSWRAEISKLRKLGFEAGTTIEEGIRATAEWLKDQEF